MRGTCGEFPGVLEAGDLHGCGGVGARGVVVKFSSPSGGWPYRLVPQPHTLGSLVMSWWWAPATMWLTPSSQSTSTGTVPLLVLRA